MTNEDDADAGWYDDGSGRQRWWDGSDWVDQYQQKRGLRWLVAPSSTAIRTPFNWFDAAFRSLLLGLILGVAFPVLQVLVAGSFDIFALGFATSILALVLGILGLLSLVFSVIALQVGIIGLGVRSGIASVESE